eukprot:NODE_10_length_47437_cov_0.363429.p23 type:complete len:150 gc:universal NODE_10_length_47437_cov_0.363429:7752-8201(+)
MTNKVPKYPPRIDEYCFITSYQTHTNREKNGEPIIRMRCLKRNLETVYNRKNPWNKLEGYYYEDAVGKDAISHTDSMSNPISFKRVDLGQQSHEYFVKIKGILTKLWRPGLDMSRKMVTGEVNYNPILENIENGSKIFNKIYEFWSKKD